MVTSIGSVKEKTVLLLIFYYIVLFLLYLIFISVLKQNFPETCHLSSLILSQYCELCVTGMLLTNFLASMMDICHLFTKSLPETWRCELTGDRFYSQMHSVSLWFWWESKTKCLKAFWLALLVNEALAGVWRAPLWFVWHFLFLMIFSRKTPYLSECSCNLGIPLSRKQKEDWTWCHRFCFTHCCSEPTKQTSYKLVGTWTGNREMKGSILYSWSHKLLTPTWIAPLDSYCKFFSLSFGLFPSLYPTDFAGEHFKHVEFQA